MRIGKGQLVVISVTLGAVLVIALVGSGHSDQPLSVSASSQQHVVNSSVAMRVSPEEIGPSPPSEVLPSSTAPTSAQQVESSLVVVTTQPGSSPTRVTAPQPTTTRVPVTVTIPLPVDTEPVFDQTVPTFPDGTALNPSATTVQNGISTSTTFSVSITETDLLHKLAQDFVVAYLTVNVDESTETRVSRVSPFGSPELLERLYFAPSKQGVGQDVVIRSTEGEERGGKAVLTVLYTITKTIDGKPTTASIQQQLFITALPSGSSWFVVDMAY